MTYIQEVWVWSIISEIEANPKKIKPKGSILLLFIFLNLLNDLYPNIIGIIDAWIWAINKIGKNKVNSKTPFILNLNSK